MFTLNACKINDVKYVCSSLDFMTVRIWFASVNISFISMVLAYRGLLIVVFAKPCLKSSNVKDIKLYKETHTQTQRNKRKLSQSRNETLFCTKKDPWLCRSLKLFETYEQRPWMILP